MAAPSIESISQKNVANSSEGHFDLGVPGLFNLGKVHANLSAAALTEIALQRKEGLLGAKGALVARAGERTGRSPQDRFVVVDPASKEEIWWGASNRPIEAHVFNRLCDKVVAYLQGRDLFVNDGWACADARYRLPVRVIAEKAWH